MPPGLGAKRLFLASALPLTICNKLSATIEDLKKSGSDTKWVEQQNIHLTIKFLGPTLQEKVEPVTKIMENILKKQSCINVTLEKLGAFPSLGNPRVIWAGLKENGNFLETTVTALEEALNRIGFEKETRKFQAHITLGRVRSSLNKISLMEKIKKCNERSHPEAFIMDNITLFESQLSSKGPVYSIIHQIKLK